MTRSVIMTDVKPALVKTKSGDTVAVCRCGLTSNADGTCSGNHAKYKVAEEEKGEVYAYNQQGRRRKVAVIDLDEDDSEGCVGGCANCHACAGCG